MTDVVIRTARMEDAEAIDALIRSHQAEGHLLPREVDEIRRRAPRFVVCVARGAIQACAELAPLSAGVAEVRSLVVARDFRRVGVAARLVDELRRRARASGHTTLTAFTHDPRVFIRQNFSIVPHTWVPEKIAVDCTACPLFRRCDQHAMILPLKETVRYAATHVEEHHAAVA